MDGLDTLLDTLDGTPRQIDGESLAALRARCPLLCEESVFGGEALRLLACDERFLVQETSDRGEILLRAWPAREAAEAFIDQRLADYERLWDG